MPAMTQTDVLVAGAGPTGLTLAYDLARRGVAVRIVDRAPEFPHGSRGKGLSPRSLEVLDDLGVVGQLLTSGVTHLPHRKYRGAQVVAETDPGDGRVSTPDVPYPTGLLIPQWRVEQALRERLAEFGVAVESGAELGDFSEDADGVTATVAGTRIQARYLVGCDGGRSTVRRGLGLRLHGETPDVQLMAVGDVGVEGLGRDAWHQWFADDGAIMLCPLPGTDVFQVQASHELAPDGTPLEPTLETFQRTFDRVAGIPGVRLHDLTWRSSYRVNIRMVDRLRVGRVLLAGDAAHVHPIAGGLGMNSGIQDAYNLGWKLGLVLSGEATPDLLDTYDEERLPIASWLLNTPRTGSTPSSPRSRSPAAAWTPRPRRNSPNSSSDTAGVGCPATLEAGRAAYSPATGHRTPPFATRTVTRSTARRTACSTSSVDPISPCSASANAASHRSRPSSSTSSRPT
jgi:2-polyprenyl-6-methoxyphenol hydroxylase-like FAD-dependent oxidoreductase